MWSALSGGLVPGSGDAVPASGEPRVLANNVAQDLHGLWLMETQGAPLFTQAAWGIPLLCALCWPGLKVPGRRWVWALGLAVVVVMALGAGIDPWRDGGDPSQARIPNPVYLFMYAHLPFFDRLWFPYRFASVGFVVAIVLVVAWWRALGARGWLLAAMVTGTLGQQAWRGDWPLRHHDARSPEVVTQAVESAPGAVLFLPMGIQHDGLMWQTWWWRPTVGGMGESARIFWPDGYGRRIRRPFIRALGDAARGKPPKATWSPADAAELRNLGVTWVILRLDLVRETHGGGEAAAEAATRFVTEVMRAEPRAGDERVKVWRLE
jgi:hypothetical protein